MPASEPKHTPAASRQAPAQLLESIRSRLRQARAELVPVTTPEVLDRCGDRLAMAVSEMRAATGLLAGARHAAEPALLGAALQLRTEILQLNALLESAGRFHLDWARLRGTLENGYTRQGKPAAASRPPRVVAEL